MRRFIVSRVFDACFELVGDWAAGSLYGARSRANEIRRFGEWLDKNLPELHPFDANASSHERKAWQTAINAWAGAVIQSHIDAPRSAGQRLGYVRQILLKLNRMGVCSKLSVPTIPSNSHKRSRQRRSLIQQVRPTKKPEHTATGLPKDDAGEELITKTLGQLAEELDPNDREELTEALVALAANFPELAPKTPEEVVLALKRLAERCIETIQSVASQKFRDWEEIYRATPDLLSAGDPEIAAQIQAVLLGDKTHKKTLAGKFRRHKRDFIPHALLCIETYYGGMPPAAKDTLDKTFCELLYSQVVGRFELDAMFAPSPDAVAAGMLLAACESALNVAPLCDIQIPLGYHPAPDINDAVVVGAIKERANGKYVISVLSTKPFNDMVPATHAMAAISDAAARQRKAYLEDIQKREAQLLQIPERPESQPRLVRPVEKVSAPLFVFRYQSSVSKANGHFLAKRLDYFLRDEGISDSFAFTPSAIRPCVLMLKDLSKSPDSLIVATLGGHTHLSNATSAYQFQLLQRLRLSSYQRQFQEKALQLASQALATPEKDEDDDYVLGDSTATFVVHLTDSLCKDGYLTKWSLERASEILIMTRREHWMTRCMPELAWATALLEKAAVSLMANRLPFIERAARREFDAGFCHFLEI